MKKSLLFSLFCVYVFLILPFYALANQESIETIILTTRYDFLESTSLTESMIDELESLGNLAKIIEDFTAAENTKFEDKFSGSIRVVERSAEKDDVFEGLVNDDILAVFGEEKLVIRFDIEIDLSDDIFTLKPEYIYSSSSHKQPLFVAIPVQAISLKDIDVLEELMLDALFVIVNQVDSYVKSKEVM